MLLLAPPWPFPLSSCHAELQSQFPDRHLLVRIHIHHSTTPLSTMGGGINGGGIADVCADDSAGGGGGVLGGRPGGDLGRGGVRVVGLGDVDTGGGLVRLVAGVGHGRSDGGGKLVGRGGECESGTMRDYEGASEI